MPLHQCADQEIGARSGEQVKQNVAAAASVAPVAATHAVEAGAAWESHRRPETAESRARESLLIRDGSARRRVTDPGIDRISQRERERPLRRAPILVERINHGSLRFATHAWKIACTSIGI